MPEPYSPFVIMNGETMPLAEAVVPLTSRALQYGNGAFSGMRGSFDAASHSIFLFRPTDHYRRLLSSLKILNAEFSFGQEELLAMTVGLIKKNNPASNIYLRPYCFDSSTEINPVTSPKPRFAFALYMLELGDVVSVTKGLSMSVSSWRRNADNAIPSRGKISGGYVNTILAKTEAMRTGHDGAIFLSAEGNVVEGSSENIFIVRNGVLITPPISDDVLEGITRATILEIARDLGITVQERSVDRSELYVADELFFSGTAMQVAWVNSVDGRVIGNGEKGPVTARLQDLFFRITRGQEAKYERFILRIPLT